ncbi:MAG: endolytic transglycosylase MltG [Clostridiales bacterium]|nr:endolytic transglycosylase MltG [Clostridiales bacterium]
MNLKKTSSTILKTSIKVLVYMLLILLFVFICSKAFSFGEVVFTESGMAKVGAGEEIQITIPSGASAKTVGDILEKNGLVESAYAFVIQTFLYEADIKPGKYKLNTEFNPAEIIVVLNGSDKDEASE